MLIGCRGCRGCARAGDKVAVKAVAGRVISHGMDGQAVCGLGSTTQCADAMLECALAFVCLTCRPVLRARC